MIIFDLGCFMEPEQDPVHHHNFIFYYVINVGFEIMDTYYFIMMLLAISKYLMRCLDYWYFHHTILETISITFGIFY